MDKKVKSNWIKALLSGKYKQGEGKLLADGKYCCLGVLCRIQGIKSPASISENGENGFPDVGFLKEVKLSKRMSRKLAELNDGDNELCPKVFDGERRGMTFKEIAAYIRKHC